MAPTPDSICQEYKRKGSITIHALDGDADTISAKTNTLAQASMKLGEAMYKQAAEQQPGGAGEAGGAEAKKDDVVDAEFTEVDDDKKKSA